MTDNELSRVATEVRKDILVGIHAAKSGHSGGSLGIADILTYLFFEEMNVRPEEPEWEDRDRFVLSKGHAAPALYAVLAERGCIVPITCMFLSFICLAALPTLAITDHGFVNVLTMSIEDPILEVVE